MARTNAQFIYEALLKQIETNLLTPGMRLASEQNLAQHYEASRMTVRKALSRLEAEGRIFCRPGIGSFVRQVEYTFAPDERKVRIVITGLGDAVDQCVTRFSGTLYDALRRSSQLYNCEILLMHWEECRPDTDADGFFCAMLQKKEFDRAAQLASRKPVVLLNRITDQPEFSYVAVDYIEATARVVRRLLLNGARNILFLGGCGDDSGGYYPHYTREQGYRLGHLQAGIPVNEDLVLPIGFHYREAEEALLRYQSDVVFVSGDLVMPTAHTAVAAALPRLANKPCFFCFDDTKEFSRLDGVSVSCGRMPLPEMCDRAIRFLAARTRGARDPETIHEIFPMGYHISDCPFLI